MAPAAPPRHALAGGKVPLQALRLHVQRDLCGQRVARRLALWGGTSRMLRFTRTVPLLAFAAASSFGQVGVADDLYGAVRLGGQPVAGAAVTLWRTEGTATPTSLAEAATDASGTFEMPGIPEG